jgi:hypothetical protein
MSRDIEVLADRARKAARAAHTAYGLLYSAVGSGSIVPSLAGVGVDLDHLSITLDLLSESTTAISSDLAHAVFETQISAGVQLSGAIVQDLDTIAGRLRSMMLSRLSELEETMHEQECRAISEMLRRYNRAVSAVLRHHELCVPRMNHIVLAYRCMIDHPWI